MYNQASRLQTYILVSLVSELKKSHIDDVFQQREGDIRCRSASNQGQVRFRKLCDLLVTDGDAPPRACGFCTSTSPSLPSLPQRWRNGVKASRDTSIPCRLDSSLRIPSTSRTRNSSNLTCSSSKTRSSSLDMDNQEAAYYHRERDIL